jgi:hypothetical protein
VVVAGRGRLEDWAATSQPSGSNSGHEAIDLGFRQARAICWNEGDVGAEDAQFSAQPGSSIYGHLQCAHGQAAGNRHRAESD